VDRVVDVERARREQEVARSTLTDERGEPVHVRRAQEHAEAGSRDGERRVRCGDANVARDGHLEAGPDGGPVDRRQHRRRVVDDRGEQSLERGPEGVTPTGLRRILGPQDEVGPGGERLVAGAGDHDGAQVIVGFEMREELHAQVGVESVPPLGPIDGRDPDALADFPADHLLRSRR
jgi:hypothetical protein